MFYIVLIIVLLILLYTYLIWNDNYWENLNVPYKKPGLVFGNLKDAFFGKINFGVIFADLYKMFPNDPYIGYFKMRSPGIILRDPEMIKTILVKDFSHFDKNDFDVDADRDPILNSNIFMQRGEQWKKNRSAWTHGLTSSKLKFVFDKLNDISGEMISYLKNHVKNKPDEALDTKELSSSLFINVIVSQVFGLDFNSFEVEENPYKSILDGIFTPSTFENIILFVFITFPKIMYAIGLSLLTKSIEKKLMKVAKEILRKREQTGFQKNNSLDVILQGEIKNEYGIEKQTAGLIFNFLIDGSETSAVVSGFTLYEIAANPDLQKRLRDELNEFFKTHDKITYENVGELIYLDMMISESLRLYPPAMILQKVCTKPYTLPSAKPGSDPIKIDKGTSILIPVYGLHMDPKHFPDPERFDPERFSPENKPTINKFAYLPFGEGPRVCIGMRFAQNQIKVGIASIIKNFEIRLAPKMKGKPLKIDPAGFIFKVVDDLWITFHEIKN